ncbi:MAG: LysM peptidoglycan-binding domain-containing protein, partial [Geminicoccaceae bacterium]
AEAISVAAAAGPADEALAVLVSRKGDGRGRILQAPGRIGEAGGLALVVLDYDDTGQIQLSGEAPPGVPLRIYVDNRLSAEARVDDKGAWIATLDRELAPGTYTLRLDQLSPEGKTVARLETPFTRASQPPVAGELQIDYVVVQPGNSLWRIARRVLGSGFDYVEIYDANRTQIRDPDLIYPGQVFAVPPTLDSG